MEPDLRQLVGLAGAPLVQALVEATKEAVPTLPARWYVSLAVAWGVALNLALAYTLGGDLRAAALVGVVTGLFASKLFDWGKRGEA